MLSSPFCIHGLQIGNKTISKMLPFRNKKNYTLKTNFIGPTFNSRTIHKYAHNKNNNATITQKD